MTLLERFLRYVSVDTQSDPESTVFPSTEKQKNLSKILADELSAMGASDVILDEKGYVYAEIPANCKNGGYVLGFISHVDTSPAVSGKDVKPVLTKNYDGGEIRLSDGVALSPEEFPELPSHAGKTIISSDGTTLLGADDKAGVAEIMTLAETLLSEDIPHGKIKIAFTPDEEVGQGTRFFDVKGFACDGAYTVDGGGLGGLEYENFNAAAVKVEIKGKSVHPGSAKGKMVNALLVLNRLNNLLPEAETPAHTEGYEGFYHIDNASGSVDSARAEYIIRDHDSAKFAARKRYFADCVDFLNKIYGEGTVVCTITDSYYNMKSQLASDMHLIDNAKKAIARAGVAPVVSPIRGGTDGATLSFKGLPCPNLFTGGWNFHGRYEYIPLEDMEKAVETLLNLVAIYKDFKKQ